MNPDRSYVTTFTGRHVGQTQGVPSLLDIVTGLSRIVRFAGQGKEVFTVLAHSLWMDDLYQNVPAYRTGDVLEEVRLAILLHDASECVVSDIPSPMKSMEQRDRQYSLDERIFNTFWARHGGYLSYCDREAEPYAAVKQLDYAALLAEYWSVGPAKPTYLPPADPLAASFLDKWRVAVFGGTMSAPEMQQEYLSRVIRLM